MRCRYAAAQTGKVTLPPSSVTFPQLRQVEGLPLTVEPAMKKEKFLQAALHSSNGMVVIRAGTTGTRARPLALCRLCRLCRPCRLCK